MTLRKNNSVTWDAHGITDVGKKRQHNEDSMLVLSKTGVWVVADGMGGHDTGDVASKMIVNSLKDIRISSLDSCIDEIEDIIVGVNDTLIKKAKEKKQSTIIGSTVVSLVIYGNHCIYLWAGDSRLYRLRKNKLTQMTVDHAQDDEADSDTKNSGKPANKNCITRAVGAEQKLFIDMDMRKVNRGDSYLLCSDGLTKHVTDTEFGQILKKGSVQNKCETLIELTLERGARDNVTAIVVDIT